MLVQRLPAPAPGHDPQESGIRLRYTWCMGGLTFFLFLVETVHRRAPDVLLPARRSSTPTATSSTCASTCRSAIMREMHRWGAHAMVITVWLHMFRVFLTGTYKPPREFNWVVGVILLVLTLLLSFTGYLLPWDQLAIWAITVGIEHGPRDAAPRARRARARRCSRSATSRSSTRATTPASRLLGGRFVGDGRAAALLRAALRRHPARRRRADGRPLLARPQGRRHLGPALGTTRMHEPDASTLSKGVVNFLTGAGSTSSSVRRDRPASSRCTGTRGLDAQGRRRHRPRLVAVGVLRLVALRPELPQDRRRSPTTCRSSA